MENTVALATETQPEDPLLQEGEEASSAAAVARCKQDCKTCIVQAIVRRMAQERPLSRTEATDLQHRFDRQAFGLKHAGDEYRRTLVEQEASLHQMAENIGGCDKAANGSRLLTVSMLGDARHHLNELMKAEKSLYISDLAFESAAKPEKEEPPYVPPKPRSAAERILREFGLGWMFRKA